MSANLIRWGELTAILGGIAFLGEAIAVITGLEAYVGYAPLLLAGYLLTAVGFIGFHVLQKENYGYIGRVGLYMAVAGSLAASLATSFVLVGGPEPEWLHIVGFLAMMVGYLFYGVATLQARV